ncbi:discoidin domain-containing receptor 2-like isoform X2 [Dysidea avara]|uniref:discoidin domain-containing receptor 2-like isoform X2 n=1 Tax=Dysidea avara TaxID=196820 RepID=UPI00331EDC87
MFKGILQVLILLAMGTFCVPLEVLSQPTEYISFQSNVFTEGSYNIDQGIGSCISRREEIEGINETIITCPQGELLTDGIKEANLGFRLSSTEIETFYTWRETLLPVKDVFITLRFLDRAITPTRVEVYCLVLQDLRVREPKNIRLYSSNTNSIYPETEIRGVDSSDTLVDSGRTILSISNGGDDDDDDDDVTASNYEYQKYTLTIPEDERILLQYLRISLDFEADNWMFINEVEVYHDNQMSSVDTPTFSVPTFTFPTINPYILHVTVVPSNLTINCTVTWEEDLSQLTTTWSYNGINISTSDRYTVNDSQLTIRGFAQEDIGIYRCTVQHPSGWYGNREYFILINQEPITPQEPAVSQEPQEPTNCDQSSDSGTLNLVVATAAGSVISVFLCIFLLFCGILYFRKKRKQKPSSHNETYPNYKNPESNLEQMFPYEENRYEKIDTAKIYSSSSTGTSTSHNPTKPPKPTVRGPTKLTNSYYYILDTALKVTNPILDTNAVTELNIYDDVVNPPTTPRCLQESIYCEAFDYSKQNTDDDTYSCISMCVPIYDDPAPLTKSEAPKLIEWNNVDVKGKIGEGQFGEVYLAELNGIDAADLRYKETNTTEILVAIKTLKGDHTASLKQQFEKEIKFMARLDNINVIRLLGICNKGMPFIMIEYMKNGDLHMFLRKHYHPTTGKDITTAEIQVDIPILLYIALQIANGMRYLASYGFIHRDLAARNCLVGEDYVVKVADFGMTQNLYNSSYFCMRGMALVPIRWMAPESFFGKFSTKTDVWSYGVTLWEIFTLCRQQPYEEMNDEDLILDVQKGPNRTLLQRPLIATDEIYNTMTRCWRHNSTQRPDFKSIYKQLLEHKKPIH